MKGVCHAPLQYMSDCLTLWPEFVPMVDRTKKAKLSTTFERWRHVQYLIGQGCEGKVQIVHRPDTTIHYCEHHIKSLQEPAKASG